MELYILDSLLRRSGVVIDTFTSAIWTERYSDFGDVSLELQSTVGNRTRLIEGTMLAMNRSNRVMIVETVEDKSASDGSEKLTISGSSIELAMDDRTARDSMSVGSDDGKWILTGLPADIVRQIFQAVMVDGDLDPNDVLPFYVDGNLYPADTIDEPASSVTIYQSYASVFVAIREICQTYDLGFRICRNADNSELFFNVYAGNNRTSGQTEFPAVIFSPYLDNLVESTFLTSSKQYKNVAYIFCADGSAQVYDEGVDPSISGFQRHVLTYEATDIKYPDRNAGPAYVVSSTEQEAVKAAQNLETTSQFQSDSLGKISTLKRLLTQDLVNINTVITLIGTTLTSPEIAAITSAMATSSAYNSTEDGLLQDLLTARALQELKKYNKITAFDGEIPKSAKYIYDYHYFLGDIVEVRNQDGVVNNVRVTEQIFSQDASGEKSYPTLSSRLVITPDVWEAAIGVWEDVDDSVHWADLP